GRIRFVGQESGGAERATGIAMRWRLSRRAIGVVGKLVRHHLRPMHLANAAGSTRPARHRFCCDLVCEGRDLAVLTVIEAARRGGARECKCILGSLARMQLMAQSSANRFEAWQRMVGR